jgi:hypothetical protein
LFKSNKVRANAVAEINTTSLVSWFGFGIWIYTLAYHYGSGLRRYIPGLSFADAKDDAEVLLETLPHLLQLLWIKPRVEITKIYFAFLGMEKA